ncbi:hypothetical protein ACFOZ0_09005 [Streptomyces yaanensis]|uniref:Secreted protein n=1 Tax=Streptomyces yaanensis TaxID=1142239 RepID=A0ABV7S9D0_9ACTN|nr:hypothetical protein [Streptomyces sp. CGMCC 4.7035]WNC02881.1 hypothetical protein Q2K21_35270 [Streptomyces sp. CGMCC 4.7035]
MGLVAVVAALPLAMASAGPVGEADPVVIHKSVQDDAKRPVSSRSAVLGFGRATAARCGPELSSPDGLEAQTCVLTQGRDTWARTYYRNATGQELSSDLSFMGPGGRGVEMHCAVGAGDDPETCETPRQRVAGSAGAYSAVAEFARGDGSGSLMLRSGSDADEPIGY